jgi:hypothetical protein
MLLTSAMLWLRRASILKPRTPPHSENLRGLGESRYIP